MNKFFMKFLLSSIVATNAMSNQSALLPNSFPSPTSFNDSKVDCSNDILRDCLDCNWTP